MILRRFLLACLALGAAAAHGSAARPAIAQTGLPELVFDHVHTYAETAAYMRAAATAFPGITRLHTIGKSYLGKDLLVLEITNQKNKPTLEKPGYWIDGNLHSGEVFGGEAALHTIRALVTGYRTDRVITETLDSKVFYIMPKLNPDGSDHFITKPDGMRSVVRPFDEDRDGLVDEDPPEDLNGDGYITMMRVRDPNGTHRTSPEDPRLMVPRTPGTDPANWQGEWRVYTEGIDNDGDGLFNEDGIGGIDINRNFPANWQPHPVSTNPGPYPLSEPETRAVVDFILTLPNLTGSINYHMSGNVAVFPPSNLQTNPITGERVPQPFEDEATYKRLGAKIVELDDVAKVQVFRIHGASPASESGSIWGVLADWMYYSQGVFGWIFEYGISPGQKELFPARGRDIDRLRWSDEHYGGKLFVNWTPFDHPQLGPVEIGGFINKVYDPRYKSYTSVLCLPGPGYDRQLAAHSAWHLFLIGQSPHVRLTDVTVKPATSGYATVTAHVENVGALPTYVTQQALIGELAKSVTATITLDGASLLGGRPTVHVGHLEGLANRSGSRAVVEWVVRAERPGASATLKAISQKGGTEERTVPITPAGNDGGR